MELKNIFRKTKDQSTDIDEQIIANIKVDYSSKTINMLPRDYYMLKRKRISFLLIIVMFAMSSTYFSYYLYQVRALTLWYDSQVYSIEALDGYSGLNEQISKFSEERNSQNLIFELKKRIDSKSKLLVDIEKSNQSILYTLSTIEDELPNGISFSSVQVDSENEIRINGFASNNKDIAVLIHNLKDTKYFKTVFVDNINYNESINVYDQTDVNYAFSISCKFGGATDEVK